MRSKIFVTFLISFIAGIFFAPYFDLPRERIFYLVFFLLSITPFFYKTKLKNILILGIIFLLAVFHYKTKLPLEEPAFTSFYNGKEVALYGYVISEPTGEKVSNFYFRPLSLQSNDHEVEGPKGNISVTVRGKNISYGDFLYLTGDLTEARKFDQKYNTYSKLEFPESEKGKEAYEDRTYKNKILVKKSLINIKKSFVDSVEKIYPEPDSSLILGLILGIKKTMPEWLKEAFNRTGTTHIVALSGFNITIIIVILRNLTKGLSRKLSFYIPVFFVFLFVVMTGGEASVVRASLMGLTLLLAKRWGRQDDPKISIAFAACLMIYQNPFILTGDVGFMLSFASMIGMIYLAPIISRLLRFLPESASENLAVTLSAQAFAAPIIIYYFKEFSAISPIANLFILPAVPLAMAFGFISAAVYFFFSPLSGIIGWIGYLFSRYIIKTAEFLSSFSFASFNLDIQNPYVFIAYYLVLINIIIFMNNKNASKTIKTYCSSECEN